MVAVSLISCGGGAGKSGGTDEDNENDGNPDSNTCKAGYEIVNDIATLKAIGKNGENMDQNYCLTANIDLAGETNGFPIGRHEIGFTSFTGNFDGQGKTISNLTIDKDIVYIGLFAKITSRHSKPSKIENLILDNFKITGKGRVGTLAGEETGNVTVSKVRINGALKVKQPMLVG